MSPVDNSEMPVRGGAREFVNAREYVCRAEDFLGEKFGFDVCSRWSAHTNAEAVDNLRLVDMIRPVLARSRIFDEERTEQLRAVVV